MAEYVGIDYSMGLSNVDRESGVHYGVIPMNSLSGYAWESLEADYGTPHCPKCGNDAIDFSSYRDGEFDFDAECGMYQCDKCDNVYYTMECTIPLFPMPADEMRCPDADCNGTVYRVEFERDKYASDNDYLCLPCHYIIDSSEAYSGEPLGWSSEDDGYILHIDSDAIDLWVLKSPFYTYAQYCSPCAPGALWILNPVSEEGPKGYCLDKSWFEGENCPYPYYSVETRERVYTPKEESTDEL